MFRSIRRRLSDRSLLRIPTHAISPVTGSGAYPLIAAIAAHLDSDFRRDFHESLADWLRFCPKRRTRLDVLFGSAGALLAAAEIEGYWPGAIPIKFVRTLQSDSVRLLTTANLGFSHGIAGCLLALEMAHRVFGVRLGASTRRRALDTLASELMLLPGRGRKAAIWPLERGQSEVHIHGWCNGGPGIGLASLGAFKLSGNKSYWDIAKLALEGTHRFATPSPPFCCGATGRAQILIEAYRQTSDPRWLACARSIAQAVRFTSKYRATGLLFGRHGLRFLKWRLAHPERLPMPWMGVLSL
ncbi:MAG: hypothetical protein HY698_00830 [Deltaproteobacteria bacterium]|nr:hypothetical protein [Deltaproteobacteria bacterium]